jgi:hypothetical protein
LGKTQDSSSKVKHHICKGKADSRLAFIVQVDLELVFNRGDCTFAITHHEEGVPVQVLNWVPRNLVDIRRKSTAIQEYQKEYHIKVDISLFAAVVHPDLGQLDRTHCEAVKRKQEIIWID